MAIIGSNHTNSLAIPLTLLLMLMMVGNKIVANSDSSKERDECAEQLVDLATCLPYVGGDAKAPTPDCCSGLKQVMNTNKKCLCVVVKDRNDPQLGLNINVTLALGLPSVCHVPADVSKCPTLLHLDPNSPEAQIFYQFGGSKNHGAGSPAPSPTPGESIGSSKGTSVQQESDGGYSGKNRRMGLEIVAAGALLWYFICSHSFI